MNETLPPRVRPRCELMTIRLSIKSFAGMVRTLVAVGTLRDASIFVTSDFCMPLRTVTVSSPSSTTSMEPVTGACAGIGCDLGSTRVVFAISCVSVVGAASVTAVGAGAGFGVRVCIDWKRSRMGHHSLSTASGFTLYCSYISSTSHALAPNSPSASGVCPGVDRVTTSNFVLNDVVPDT